MAASQFPERPQNCNDDMSELTNELESMIESTEKISVQLTWMAYDMVALRTNPDRGSSMQKLEEASQRCRAAVCGDRDPKPEMGKHLEDAAGTHPD